MKRYSIMLFSAFTNVSCSRTVYVVRHAEKQDTAPAGTAMMRSDPPLSEAGKVRALVLRDLLKYKHIRNIYSTTTQRTFSMVKPLSDALNLPIERYSNDTLSAFINFVRSALKGNALIVGHSNTVDDIVNHLCGTVRLPADLNEREYDHLFVVTYRGKKVRFKDRRFGYPSNP